MGAVKNHFHDQICALPDPDEGVIPEQCEECGHWFARLTDGVCALCDLEYEEGQFEDRERC